MSERKKLVPKDLSKIKSKEAANKTGKANIPKIAVIKKLQIVKGNLKNDIPVVLRLIIVVI
jgi:hypothetical protein